MTPSASQEAEKIKFFELADRLSASSNPAERKRIKAELGRITFGKQTPPGAPPFAQPTSRL